MNKKNKIVAISLAVVISFCFSIGGFSARHRNIETAKAKNIKSKNKGEELENLDRDIVKMEIEGKGFIKIALYPEFAPKTVENFLELVSSGFYNGLTFHRVVSGFMAQGGDPIGNGTGGSEKQITGEFSENNFSVNTLEHKRGTISMARSSDFNSASSQFFICYNDASFLDGKYAPFGKVIEGMEVVDNFTNCQMKENAMGENAEPVEPIIISSAIVLKKAE